LQKDINILNQEIWESRYGRGEVVNRYPYDSVVSFVLREFGKSNRESTRILDFGCGTGNHLAFWAQEGYDYYGIDYSSSAIRQAKLFLEDSVGIIKPGRLIHSDLIHAKFPDNYFDAVIDRQTLDQNMSSTLPAIVSEIFRILKPSGKYLGMNFSDCHPAVTFGKALGNGDYAEFTSGPFKNIGARHFFNEIELRDLFRQFAILDLKKLSMKSLIHKDLGSEEFVLIAQKNY